MIDQAQFPYRDVGPEMDDGLSARALLLSIRRHLGVVLVLALSLCAVGAVIGLGLPPRFQAALEVRGRISGSIRSNPVVIATVNGKDYLVSMLGPDSDWVKNVEAAHGDAVIRQGRRRPVRLVAVPPEQRAPVLREYVRIASSGRRHFPLPVGAPLSDFEAIVERYPVYRIDTLPARAA